MRRIAVCSCVAALAITGTSGAPHAARAASDLQTCADERVKTATLPLAALAAAEIACERALAASPGDADRQKAVFFRGLLRFLQVVQKGADLKPRRDGSLPDYRPPTLGEVRPALADVAAAIAIEGPLKSEALTLRVTINQTIGRQDGVDADIEAATRAGDDPTPFVQRALESERAGNVRAALTDLNRAVEIDPRAGTALSARGELLRRLGILGPARKDLAAAAALGAPYRRVALMRKSELELRAGDLQAAYDDLVASSREAGDMPKADAAALSADLFVRAGDLALDKLKEPDAAEKLYAQAQKLVPKNWSAALGLARVEERRGAPDKAAAIYRRILAATKGTPRLPERALAAYLLKRLSEPLLRESRGPFRDAFEAAGVTPGKGSPDGLKRVAFVIGESDYAELTSLPNARRDAAVMASALAEMGFDVVEIAENLGKADLRSVPAIVAARAAEADVALVFYAGHGVETGGANYLIAVDAAPETDTDLSAHALALSDLTAAAAKAKRGSLVIIDACRDDPFVEARAVAQSRSAGQLSVDAVPEKLHAGLAAMPAPAANSVVFHSTQPGEVALDGDGLDSPFVRSLLETLGTPGQTLGIVVGATTERVAERTDGRQRPAAYGEAPAVALLPPAAR